MTLQQAIALLRYYNAWRRDIHDTGQLTMPHPTEIGQALDIVLDELERREAQP